MRKFLSRVFVLAGMLAVAACGGGGDSKFETPGGNGGPSAPVSTLGVTSTATSIPGDGSATATITALAKDANNNAMSGVGVTFSSNGGSLVVTQATTDASGVATATLAATGMASGSTIAVTATGGGATGTVNVAVANTQQTVTLATDLPQIPSDGSKQATITAFVRGASNQLLKDVTVNFMASSGGIVVTRGITDANGTATATLSTTGDPANREITVTASAGSATATVPVDVVGSKLTIAGATNLVLGATATYNVSLTDSGNNAIANKPVTVASSKNNSVNPATTLTTDSSGHAAFNLTGTAAGADTLTLSALGMRATQTVNVSNENFAITAPAAGTKIPLGNSQNVTVTWLTAGVPQPNKTVTFAVTRGVIGAAAAGVSVDATTDANGQATVAISSINSGPVIVTATSTGVTAQLEAAFVATVPAMVDLQASPATVPTQGTSTITAIIRDAGFNLVQDKTVNFQLTDITGGALSLPSAVTDSQGRAQTVYTASSTPSSTKGVTVTATVQGTGITKNTQLTVGGQTVFVKLVTGNKLAESADFTQFLLPYTAMAIDAAGNPVNGVNISLTAHSLQYQKGTWVAGTNKWIQVPTFTCPNEDLDNNGVYTPSIDADQNGNKKLEPGDIAVTTPGQVTTANTGSASFQVVYGQDHAAWVQVAITATATVQGTESSDTAIFWLPMLAKYVNDINTDIPGKISPYGTQGCNSPN